MIGCIHAGHCDCLVGALELVGHQGALDHLDTAPVIDDEFIGSALKTIESLIIRETPHSYRSRAGL